MSMNGSPFDVDRREAIDRLARREPFDRDFGAIGDRLLALGMYDELSRHIKDGLSDLFNADFLDDLEQ